MKNEAQPFFARQAWVAGAWARDVLLGVSSDGHWNRVEPHCTAAEQASAIQLAGPVLPGVVNAHSHAFQRAIVGLTERRTRGAGADDDFWSWRDRMYSAANCITPQQLETIASQLYAELLAGGYTQVCEFHYLHNALGGAPYADVAEMSLALVRAARRTGMGLTLLPTLYMRAGFADAALRPDQRRFASTPDSIARMVEDLQRHTQNDANINVGVALHSLRAVSPAAVKELAASARQAQLPVHIHIAEQTQEVDECLVHTGLRPIEWLLEHVEVDARWNLVHATHATRDELAGVQARGAAIVICPATEANLGDGVFDLAGYAAVKGAWSIGSDSHVTRRWSEELRLLEYSQRLTQRKRNRAAQWLGAESSAAALLEAALRGGHNATGLPVRGIAVGQRADFCVLDANAPSLLGMPADHVLDALVFSSPDARFASVHVGGQPAALGNDAQFAQAMHALWGG